MSPVSAGAEADVEIVDGNVTVTPAGNASTSKIRLVLPLHGCALVGVHGGTSFDTADAFGMRKASANASLKFTSAPCASVPPPWRPLPGEIPRDVRVSDGVATVTTAGCR